MNSDHKDKQAIDNLLVNIDGIDAKYAEPTQLRLAIMKLATLEKMKTGTLEKTKTELVNKSGIKYVRVETKHVLVEDQQYVKFENKYIIVDGELLVGLTIDEAKAKYPGIWISPCKIDGEYIAMTSGACWTYRHNVVIEKGKIIGYTHNG